MACRHPWPRTPPRPPVGSPPDECGPESCGRQHRFKSVEWGSPPFVGPDDSRGAVSDSSSWRLDERFGVEKVTGRPPRAPGHISFQHIASPARSFSRDPDAEPEGGAGRVSLVWLQSLPNALEEAPQSLALPVALREAAGAPPASSLRIRVVLEASEIWLKVLQVLRATPVLLLVPRAQPIPCPR